ncbi:MAG TPA: 30S ribosomal protein S20 [Bacillota bacterium]|nr:30S ribosomal protein S20 [Bacillota bacterium]HOH10655.1 30S ribosomal protein S20 [Bacillota bacterium]HOS51073.1 30S ribosomal protein S20 [Bacillota bacterium]HOY88968.1 30S ribosomal protein S20 [Bacillota bacterium]HPI01951.1 30S ribosomal protein S20 [Bacillota bacterium]
MPRNLSGEKRNRTSQIRAMRNASIKSSVKTAARRVNEAIALNDAEVSSEKLSAAYSVIDRAVKKGVIHANQGARRKARLAAKVNEASKAE